MTPYVTDKLLICRDIVASLWKNEMGKDSVEVVCMVVC